ncbi:MAG: LacI family transcriptional regulator [Actinomycetota bacterium]|nr:LacI family transcriptional regulator [Actinomycetota bacterium]
MFRSDMSGSAIHCARRAYILTPTLFSGSVTRFKLTDVAREAGVHPSTASRALNPLTRDKVGRQAARRVIQAAERLGYVPNTLARGLRTARSFVVAMIVPDVTNPLFPPMVRGAEQVLSSSGYTLVLTDTDNDAATERRHVQSMRGRGVDGFIVATARWHDDLLDELAASGVPAVLVNRRTATNRLPYVGADERAGIQLAVDHLVGLGHRNIAHLAGPADTSTGRERADAFRQALAAHGLAVPARSMRVCSSYTEAAGLEMTRRLLASGTGGFTAIVAANDLIALGVLAALNEKGLRCPADVSLIGFNDLPLIDRLTPPMTTIRLPLHELGELAAQTLLKQMTNPHPAGASVRTLLGIELVVRGTTAPASAVRRTG